MIKVPERLSTRQTISQPRSVRGQLTVVVVRRPVRVVDRQRVRELVRDHGFSIMRRGYRAGRALINELHTRVSNSITLPSPEVNWMSTHLHQIVRRKGLLAHVVQILHPYHRGLLPIPIHQHALDMHTTLRIHLNLEASLRGITTRRLRLRILPHLMHRQIPRRPPFRASRHHLQQPRHIPIPQNRMVLLRRRHVQRKIMRLPIREEWDERRDVDRVAREVEGVDGVYGAPGRRAEAAGEDDGEGEGDAGDAAVNEEADFAEGALAVGEAVGEGGEVGVGDVAVLRFGLFE